jgi:hypothetical protein
MTNTALRPLAPEEEKLLGWILQHGSNKAKSYLPQVEGLRVRRSCSCGCPSISLVVSHNAQAVIAADERIVADLTGRTAEGASVGVLIFQDEGKLSELEVYAYGCEGEFDQPTIASLTPFEASKSIS